MSKFYFHQMLNKYFNVSVHSGTFIRRNTDTDNCKQRKNKNENSAYEHQKNILNSCTCLEKSQNHHFLVFLTAMLRTTELNSFQQGLISLPFSRFINLVWFWERPIASIKSDSLIFRLFQSLSRSRNATSCQDIT